ncbi:LysE family translocator [Sneathiella limimaris]|uniref:LysE family translocator n=1 Tax=Sneathiella limimaris TaxID=1964213 RepID=UPI00146E5826|nr:LysE family translocator [Sneathiella limimaris]
MSVAFTALLSYSFLNSATPGPNNIMLASSGVNFGFKRTIPHFLGVYLGFLFMLAVVCFGLGEIFTRFPEIQPIMKYAGSAYLLYLAWRVSQSSSIASVTVSKPFTFLEAALFQYINPKAWILAGTIPSAFVETSPVTLTDIGLLVTGHAMVSLPAILFWVLAGTQLRRYLSSPTKLKIFNYVMAILLVGTVGLILFG